MNLIAECQDAAENYGTPFSELPVDLRQLLASLAWKETPYLEPFEDWSHSRAVYVWVDLIADMLREFRPNTYPQSPKYQTAVAAFLSAITDHALAWAEKHAEDQYDAEFDKESTNVDEAAENRYLNGAAIAEMGR